MVVRFTWRPGEWREACLLARMQQNAERSVPMAYLVAGMMLLGGAGEALRAMNGSRDALLQDSLLPALLLVGALALSVGLAMPYFRRRGVLRELPAVPRGEQQVTLHELGWSAPLEPEQPAGGAVRGWSELLGLRTGRRVLTLVTRDGRPVGVPLRALSRDQGDWVERLLLRKVPRLV